MVTVVNSKADVLKASAALAVNCNSAKGLQEVMKSNLGPRGTLKMLVGGAGQIKVTKDGNVLLHEMQIQHPTASMIARAATAQDDMVGDGTTTNVLFTGELMRQAEWHLQQGVHARLLVEGIDMSKSETLKFLETFKVPIAKGDTEKMHLLAKTALRTKLQLKMADQLAENVVEALQTIHTPGEAIDLNMVEIMHIREALATDSKLVRGMVMDHGSRHDDMPEKLENCYIMTLNVSLEYEKTEVNSSFAFSSADQRDKLVESERKFTDEKVKKIVALKRQVCTAENKKTFVVINQKGIDQPSLDMLAKEGIIGLRRAKRRNMERLTLACGGVALNSVDDMEEADLGYADLVYEQIVGDEKYTFVEGVKNPKSCTLLVKGPNEHTIAQLKDAVRDGLRAVENTINDQCVIPGAGAFEIAAHEHLETFKKTVKGKARLGVEIFGQALMIVPKVLAENSGLDVMEVTLKAQAAHCESKQPVGIDVLTGEPCAPGMAGIYDNYCVKKQMLNLTPVLAQQLLLVDEVIRAGRQMSNKQTA
jgi:T-complex protein 1 subunit zeta